MSRIIQSLGIGEELKLKYLEGYSIRDLAKLYNINKNVINNYLNSLGITRTNLEWKNDNIKYNKFKMRMIEIGISRTNVPQPKIRKYDIDEKLFEDMTLEFDSYMFGLILTDGSISKNYNTITIQVQQNDKTHMEQISKLLKVPLHEYNGYPTITLNSTILCERLKKLGCNNNKTENPLPITIPTNENAFLRGVIDGDGCIYIKDNGSPTISIGGTNKQLIEWINMKFREYGSKSSISLVNDRPSQLTAKRPYKLNFYETIITGSFAVKLLSDIYYDGCFCLERKYIKAKEGMLWQKSRNLHKTK